MAMVSALLMTTRWFARASPDFRECLVNFGPDVRLTTFVQGKKNQLKKQQQHHFYLLYAALFAKFSSQMRRFLNFLLFPLQNDLLCVPQPGLMPP
jgi:uncharacterized membrane protein YbaN (DUF454 family)